MAGGSIDDKLDRYYDDLMGKLIDSIEVQQRFLGEQKDMKKEVSRLREIVLQLESQVQSVVTRLKSAPPPAESHPAPVVESVRESARAEPVAKPAAEVASRSPAPSDNEKPTEAKHPRTLKEYLADGVSLYDVKVLNAFIRATKEVIKANCRKEPVFLKPRVEDKLLLPVFVVGKMKLSRDGGQGAMALGFERPCMESVARDVLFLPPDTVISETDGKDVTSELCNQVCGRSKILLRAEGYNFDISLPSVMANASPAALFKEIGGLPKVALGFEYDKAPFYVLFWG